MITDEISIFLELQTRIINSIYKQKRKNQLPHIKVTDHDLIQCRINKIIRKFKKDNSLYNHKIKVSVRVPNKKNTKLMGELYNNKINFPDFFIGELYVENRSVRVPWEDGSKRPVTLLVNLIIPTTKRMIELIKKDGKKYKKAK